MTRVCEMVDLQFAPDADYTSIHVFDMAMLCHAWKILLFHINLSLNLSMICI